MKEQRTGDAQMTLRLPHYVVRQLRVRAAEEATSVRALVLAALKNSGYEVMQEDIVDRRRG